MSRWRVWWLGFDRAGMDQIVARVRASGLAAGEVRAFRLEGGRLVELPERTVPRGSGAGRVMARQGERGLQVVIQTRDLGHAGEYGFAFSEQELEPEPAGDGGAWRTLDLPSHLQWVTAQDQIDRHWWRVRYNLG
jgi:hypothetical protein